MRHQYAILLGWRVAYRNHAKPRLTTYGNRLAYPKSHRTVTGTEIDVMGRLSLKHIRRRARRAELRLFDLYRYNLRSRSPTVAGWDMPVA